MHLTTTHSHSTPHFTPLQSVAKEGDEKRRVEVFYVLQKNNVGE